MRDLLIKRKKLCDLSKNLRSIKFDAGLEKKDINYLIHQQNEVYKRYKFYDNYIKVGGKLKCQKKDMS